MHFNLNKMIMKTDIEIRDKLMSLTTNNERRKLLFEWVKTGIVTFKQFDKLIYYCA
jgi:hypothetical protein